MSDQARPATLAQRIGGMIAALWVGSQLTIGYAVAPVLFTTLDHGTAGSLAAQLFGIEKWIGFACAFALIVIIAQGRARGTFAQSGLLRRLVVGMMFCVLAIDILQLWMEPMRIAALLHGTDVEHGADAARFGWMHGVSSAVYLVESVLGLVLLWRWPGRPA
jgi:hypothetical protein